MGIQLLQNLERLIFEPKTTFISQLFSTITAILALSLLHCVEIHCIEVAVVSAPPVQLFRQHNVCHLVVNRFTRHTSTVDRKHFFMNIFCIESYCCAQKTDKKSSSTVSILTTETSL
jgi:hypothetical protein